MSEYVIEELKRTIIDGEYDVIVVGGGIAGVSAALSAQRDGAKTLLIEREYTLGGLATLGLVTIFLPLCDGKGNQISYGIAEELIRLSVQYGAEIDIPVAWKKEEKGEKRQNKRYMARFSSHMMAILCEELLNREGVEILYGTQVCAAAVNEQIINAVIVENQSGRIAYKAKSFVDASGDANLAFFAGSDTEVFPGKNALAAWYYAQEREKMVLHPLGVADVVDENTEQEKDERIIAEELSKDIRYSGLNAKENSRYMIEVHHTIKEHFLKYGRVSEEHNLASMPMLPQFRMTRRIVGKGILKYSEKEQSWSDSIGMIGDWTKKGPHYEIPLNCLCSKTVRNLLAAGRCISTDDNMWEMTRVIPACAVTGEAAGVAASVYAETSEIDTKEIQKRLSNRGILMHFRINRHT